MVHRQMCMHRVGSTDNKVLMFVGVRSRYIHHNASHVCYLPPRLLLGSVMGLSIVYHGEGADAENFEIEQKIATQNLVCLKSSWGQLLMVKIPCCFGELCQNAHPRATCC